MRLTPAQINTIQSTVHSVLGEDAQVTQVEPLSNHCLKISFNTGDVKVFDVKPYLNKGIFGKLRDPALFNQAYVAYDTVCWPGNLDIAPETLFIRGISAQ
jgi:hypothetical protein